MTMTPEPARDANHLLEVAEEWIARFRERWRRGELVAFGLFAMGPAPGEEMTAAGCVDDDIARFHEFLAEKVAGITPPKAKQQ